MQSYGDYEITVNIDTGVVEGKFPKRALHQVLDWYEIHKEELVRNWDLSRQNKMPDLIEPLE